MRVLTVCLAAPGAHAADFPAMFDVTGVAAGDVLNVRVAPDAGAAAVASLPPDRTGVEVLARSADGKWLQVGLGELGGWAAARYLSAQPPRPGDRLPTPLRCFGTEPFWSLHMPAPLFAEYERLPDPPRALTPDFAATPAGGGSTDLVARMTAPGARATLVMRHEACADGMSDRPYGLSATLLLETRDAPAVHSGCCSLTSP